MPDVPPVLEVLVREKPGLPHSPAQPSNKVGCAAGTPLEERAFQVSWTKAAETFLLKLSPRIRTEISVIRLRSISECGKASLREEEMQHFLFFWHDSFQAPPLPYSPTIQSETAMFPCSARLVPQFPHCGFLYFPELHGDIPRRHRLLCKEQNQAPKKGWLSIL